MEGELSQISDLQDQVDYLSERFTTLREQVSKVVVGQEEVVNGMLEAILANGHILVEGVPGIGKTLLVRVMSIVTGCEFSRIQFTPDLLPTDIVGVTTYEEGRGFFTIKGPIFSNFVLADEINRAPPKVQSALLESMQERQATIGKETFQLPEPFFVMATQNPVEQIGTYQLPEAQVDRFIFKVLMEYPGFDEEIEVLEKNITTKSLEDYDLEPVLTPQEITEAQRVVKEVELTPKIRRYIVRFSECTRNPEKYDIDMGRYVDYGASPRSSIGMYITSKAHALIDGRTYVTAQDVKDVAHRVLRHRITLNFEGEAEEVHTDRIIDEMLQKIPVVEA